MKTKTRMDDALSAVSQAPPPQRPPHRHRSRFHRIFRGYLMLVGAIATLYALARLVVLLLIEISKWM